LWFGNYENNIFRYFWCCWDGNSHHVNYLNLPS
jgi:hypothetical protein